MTQLLIYEQATPVSAQRHANWSIETRADYSFSRSVNSVPLMAVEMLPAAGEYPVVFGGSGEAVMPVVILGLRAGENLFVDDAGGWKARYIPAFIRRYPFVFSTSEDGSTFTLCIDESFKGLNQQGRGERLFDDQHKATPYVERVLGFLQQYQAEFTRTQTFCRRLNGLNLLEPMQAQVRTETGDRIALTGFSVVDRTRLKALPAETVAELLKSDELEWIHAHLASLRNFTDLRERGGAR